MASERMSDYRTLLSYNRTPGKKENGNRPGTLFAEMITGQFGAYRGKRRQRERSRLTPRRVVQDMMK